jgi:serine/threonine protein kinase/tetratricopeptide (TPR) repeat protein
MPEPASEQSLFLHALELPTPADRAAYLDTACRDNPGLRAELDALLAAHDRLGGGLPPITGQEPARPGAGAGGEEVGAVLSGRYKLVELLGEGGMGAVWMAQQTEPVRRLVAVKVVKAGMDSKQVLARFEAERQALALMDHPNIARVLDAGTTAAGRPYFVMELVKGLPITRYCDERRLAPRQRLELFVSVCLAVQHAHQKGIIHRDLKPSNVLVALYDGKPVPKVIDFGVAKATGQQLTEHTLVTGFGAVVGTLEYMSPEQAELNQLDIDTRSDVYSLGVLLYELLTGTTPLDRKRLKEAALLEVLRLIREEEPPRPSARLSTTDEMPSVAANRGLEPKKLSGAVRGELDWIVMKSLEKDRDRRYDSANGLAMDVQRYLADEPVLACPPSASYRLRKFARRNKTALRVAVLLLFFVVLLGAGGGWLAYDRAARRVKLNQDLQLALQAAEMNLDQGKRADARAVLDQAERLASEATTDPAHHVRLTELGQRLEAEERDRQFIAGYEDIRLRVQTEVDVVNSRFTGEAAFPPLRELFRQYGISFVGTPVKEGAERILNRPESVRHQLIAALYSCKAPKDDTRTEEWLQALLEAADTDPWRRKIRKAIVARDWEAVKQLVRSVDVTTQPPGSLVPLAELIPAKRMGLRLDFWRRIQRVHPDDLWANHQLGMELIANRRHGEAIRYFTAALALRRDNPGIYLNRGLCLAEVKETEAAIADYERCLVLAPNYFMAFSNLTSALKAEGRLQEALAVCNKAVEASPGRAAAWSNRAIIYYKLHEPNKAITDSTRAIELDAKAEAAWATRGGAYRLLGQYEKAIADCTKALELDEKNAIALAERGQSYFERGEHKKALADCSRSLELDPTDAFTWYTRGVVYRALGDQKNALADCLKAVDLAQQNPWTHYNLGIVLRDTERTQDAIAAFRKATELDKDIAEFHCNLGGALHKQGQLREALAEMRRGHELRSKRPNWPYPSDQWVRQLERLVELDEHLPDFLSGKTRPASPEERIELAELCVRKQLNLAAVRFYDEAFTPVSPRTAPLIGAYRYNAACAAALAGCGQGKDAEKLDDKGRARLRQQALDWLRADLAANGRVLDTGPEQARPLALRQLQHCQADPDFTGVRDQGALARLPERERQAWQQLWGDVRDRLAKARGPATPKPAGDR